MREYIPEPQSYERPWWRERGCTTMVFRERIAVMDPAKLRALAAEIDAAIAATEGQLDGAENDTDWNWRRRAIKALGFIREKRHLLTAELHRRDAEHPETARTLLADARRALAVGDRDAALERLLDWAEECR